MSSSGAAPKAADPQADLQVHITVVGDAIGKMIFDELGYHVSSGALKLIKDFLNTISLNFLIELKREDTRVKHSHIKSLILYAKIPESKAYTTRLTTDDEVAKDYAYEPLSALALTLKLFHQFLKAKKAGYSLPTFSSCFSSEFHLFAYIVSAAIVANKVVYDEISPHTMDFACSFEILHDNILRLLETLFLRNDLRKDSLWAANFNNAISLLRIIASYDALSEDEKILFEEVERIMPEAGKKSFRHLYQQLHILSLFKSIEQRDSDFNLFYSDTENSSDDDDFDDDIRSKSSNNRDIRDFEDEHSHTSLNLYENQFLKTIAFKTHFCFSIHDACELLSNAKKYVAAHQSSYAGFDLLLGTFGNNSPETRLQLGITRPTHRQMQCLFDRFKEMSMNPLKATESIEQNTVRATLQRASY